MNEKIECEKCHKLITKRYIDHHLKIHERNKPKTIRCCKNCNTIKPLKEFYLSLYTCKECLCRKVTCEKCDKVYSFNYMQKHILAYHGT